MKRGPGPLCKCHGVPRLWQKIDGRKDGGTWTCRVKKLEAARQRRKSAAVREAEYAVNREAYRRRQAELAYHKRYPESHARAEARRRARMAGVEHEDWTRQQVWERGEGRCHMCRRPLPPKGWHVDHVIPISRGGRDALDNLLPSCPPCNRAKGARVDIAS